MALKLYNTLSLKKEEFKPLKNKKVGLYTCGPTVYNFVHIGNLRTFIFEDILRRTLEHNNYQVKHVMNITDVGHLVSDENEGEDKIEKSAREQKKTAWDIAKFYTQEFKKDIADLNIEPAQIMPRATDHIKEQMALIKILEKKGFTYKTSDGIYFDTSKFKKYGKLGKVNIKGLKAGARIKKGDKKHHTDFALWKFSPQLGSRQAHRQMEWSSPWGIGFPGWHIECSAMAVKYLSQPFDIHTGGIDHIPIHHQNEIAQSEGAYDKPLANYWMHGEFLVIDKKKMAKSESNFITLKILKEQGYHPLVYRFFVLNAHYRTQLNFSWEAMESAQAGLEHLYNQVSNLKSKNLKLTSKNIDKKFKQKFLNAINDDLNTPKALAVMQELLKSRLVTDDCKLATILDFDKILGLKIKESLVSIKIPEKIKKIAEERLEARQNKDWNKSDILRKKINQLGFKIKDTKDGYTLKKS
ncbi:cysteine--tRNA ligase [Patescibacteria group bacterium]|nr:cysteine--tRNA ligase [Patescibacteria group bacterium]